MEKISGLFASLRISSSGLAAQRRRMNIIAENLANANTTKTDEGGPYKRKIVRFFEQLKSAEVRRGAAEQRDEGLESTSSGHISGGSGSQVLRRTYSGVRIEVVQDKAEPERVYDPTHPDADEAGYVAMPKVDTIVEMVDMITAARAYEAGVTAINTAKDMARKALEI
ncbi:MAG: flagellar basal body rod protein FlgC [Calditrichaeota bacterium]|nr:flagellar basal body rod protein FlgC [Calditrichota bacterium]